MIYFNFYQHCFSKPIPPQILSLANRLWLLISSSIEEVLVFLISVVRDLMSYCRYSLPAAIVPDFAGTAAIASVHVVASDLATASVSGVAQSLLLLLVFLPAAEPPC